MHGGELTFSRLSAHYYCTYLNTSKRTLSKTIVQKIRLLNVLQVLYYSANSTGQETYLERKKVSSDLSLSQISFQCYYVGIFMIFCSQFFPGKKRKPGNYHIPGRDSRHPDSTSFVGRRVEVREYIKGPKIGSCIRLDVIHVY